VAGLDRHRYRRVRVITGLGQQLQQRGEPGRVVADPTLASKAPSWSTSAMS
jgi:hypothetical protein